MGGGGDAIPHLLIRDVITIVVGSLWDPVLSVLGCFPGIQSPGIV